MDGFVCPYCGQDKDHAGSADTFKSCRFCGFKSAMIRADDGKLLIVDRRMPYLKKRCKEISEKMPDVNVIVDRRIAQDPLTENDRRLNVEEQV